MKVHELITLLGKCPANAEIRQTMEISVEELIKKGKQLELRDDVVGYQIWAEPNYVEVSKDLESVEIYNDPK